MQQKYSVEIIRNLQDVVYGAELAYSPLRGRHDPGDVLDVEITGVFPALRGRAELAIDAFVGGGFAGQVYRATLQKLELADEGDEAKIASAGRISGLEPGGTYAIKVFIPPSPFSRKFRDAIYWLAYQGAFSAQVNPAAVRAGALWQKLIRRAAALRFGSERAIVDTYATFFDSHLGSYGEISEWVSGRTWRFEVDDRLFHRMGRRTSVPTRSHEYVEKRRFMAELVELLHEMGAPELARQYEWYTAKSQPNVLKRLSAGDPGGDSLTAIDWRAGLALLPFLPMSPADFKLILRGLARGRLVQFDRGNLRKLRAFMEAHPKEFAGLEPVVEELAEVDAKYRRSLPDVTGHHVRLLSSRSLSKDVAAGAIQGWRAKGLVDEGRADKLARSRAAFWLFSLVGALPILGKFLRRVWGVEAYRAHVKACLTSWGYMCRALRARRASIAANWYRAGRISGEHALALPRRPVRFILEWMSLALLPAKWHRLLGDPSFTWSRVRDGARFIIRFYRNAAFREEWLRAQVESGREEGMLTSEEAESILRRVKEPFIQKYLKCVAVHFCTLPVTQVVSLIAALYAFVAFGETWGQSVAYASGILAIFQLTPISPGSIARGSYVVYLMLRERNVRDYWMAGLVSFWHYVGYLGFPLQMVQHYPLLSRFMAGRWATQMTHIIPVFGERGALLEHWVFDAFFNLPLTFRRYWLKLPRAARLALGYGCGVAFLFGVVGLIWYLRFREVSG